MYMPWGKYKGRRIASLPSGYLAWLLEECDSAAPWLADAARREMAERFGGPPAQAGGPSPELEAKVAAWYRRLTLQFHPDRGGSDQAMAALNVAREELCSELGLPR